MNLIKDNFSETKNNDDNKSTTSFRRKKLFIKKDFQIRMILIILLITIIFANINGIIIYSFFTRTLGVEAILNWMKISDPVDIIFQVIFVTESIGILIIFFIAIFVSHRLAGPIYKIGLTLDKISKGNLNEPMKLRKNDEFREIEIEINNAVEGLKDIVNDINTDIDSLEIVLNEKKISDKDVLKALKNLKKDMSKFIV
jgi:methyl-accepting chemotaxis protein